MERGIGLHRPFGGIELLENEHGDSRASKVSSGNMYAGRYAKLFDVSLVRGGTHALEPTAVANTWNMWKSVRRNWSMITDGR